MSHNHKIIPGILPYTRVQGLQTGFDIMYLTMRDRNIQVRFGLKVVKDPDLGAFDL